MNDGSWERNAPELNARGLELQALIKAANAGRPVRLHVDNVVPFPVQTRRAA